MKSTLEIPEGLLREADLAAQRAGLSLNDFLAGLLKEKLVQAADSSRLQWPVPPPNLDKEETRRIQKLIDDEFGGIDSETWR